MAFTNPVFDALPDPGRRRLLRLGGAALAGGSLPLLAGAADTPVRGGTLVAIAHPEPSTLATHVNGANPISIVTSKIYDRLFTEGNDYALLPRLGLGIETSADGLDWTIRLRKGVRWHDGHPFDAGDVKFSIEQIWPTYHSAVTNVIAKVSTPDAHTVVLRLKEKWPILVRHLGVSAGQILPQHLFEGTDILTNPYNNKPVGTGPFRFKEWQRGSHIVLERNPDYYLPGLPHLDRIVWKVINDSASRAAALETGAAHYAARNPITFSDAARLKGNPNLAIDTQQYEPNSYWLEFNLRDPVIGKLAVRQAIAHAIDRAALVKTVWGGYGAPLDAPVPSGVPEYFTKDVPTYPFDPKRAEQLLDAAGLPRKAGGWRFRLTHDFIPFGDDYRRTGEFVRQALRRVGIDVSLGAKDLSTWTRDVFTKRDFQVISTWGGWTRDPQNNLEIRFGARGDKRGVPWYKVSGYANREVEALLAPTRSGADPALRKTNYRRVQQLVQAELPVLPLLEVYFFSVFNKRVRNVNELPYQTRNNWANVWLAKA
ncbi:ABC transporter substrate-binding protein [Massilia sp. METH4]|uniref:ABC transporter substrate-binding protein n=1 Tax=Massilia sp. METH4 TaxID=3123041 RepID=UPI0030CDD3C7